MNQAELRRELARVRRQLKRETLARNAAQSALHGLENSRNEERGTAYTSGATDMARTLCNELSGVDVGPIPNEAGNRAAQRIRELLKEAREKLRPAAPAPAVPIPMLLWCPECGDRHVDRGAFATKVHRNHACQNCGLVWRPALLPTVGVQFLPGFKD